MQKLPKTPEKSGQSPQNNRAQREKISCRAKQDPRKEEQPELPLPHIERKAEQRQKKQQQKQPPCSGKVRLTIHSPKVVLIIMIITTLLFERRTPL